MSDGQTCYERDEVLCEDQMCLRTGCRIRNERLGDNMTAPSPVTDEAERLALVERLGTLAARQADIGNGTGYLAATLRETMAFITEQARQLAEIRERRLPESETDDDPPKSGFRCACLFDDQTAEPVQVCVGHGRVNEELADCREQRKELLDAKYTLLLRANAAEADRDKLASQYDALLLERTLERKRMDRLESENVALGDWFRAQQAAAIRSRSGGAD